MTTQHAIHMRVKVLPGGQIALVLPELAGSPGHEVEVIVLLPQTPPDERRFSALDILANVPEKRGWQSAEEVAVYLQEERGGWES